MTGEAEILTRDSSVLGRSYLGGPRVIKFWRFSWSRTEIGVCLVRDGSCLCWRGAILKPLEGYDEKFARDLPILGRSCLGGRRNLQ